MASSRQDSDSGKPGAGPTGLGPLGTGPLRADSVSLCVLSAANSVASYENQGVTGTPVAPAGRRLRPVLGSADPVSLPPEAACEDADEDDYDEDYNNEGYL